MKTLSLEDVQSHLQEVIDSLSPGESLVITKDGEPVATLTHVEEHPMTTISIEEAQAKLPELIGGLSQGEELAITQGDRVVARIVGEPLERRQRLAPGFAKGMIAIVSEDDDHLRDFAEYMP